MYCHIPFPHLPSQENASRLIMTSIWKVFVNTDLTFREEINIYKSSASKGFFGVFIPLLGITVLAKSENSGVKSLGNSPITESNSSIYSLFILCAQSYLSYKCGKWYIQLGWLPWLLWLRDIIWLFQSSLTDSSSSLMIPIEQWWIQLSTTGSSVLSNSKLTES